MRVGIRGDLERRKCVDFNTSRKWGRDNLKKLVLQYIGEHGFITRATYTQLTGRLKNTALDDLKSFAAEGIIKREDGVIRCISLHRHERNRMASSEI